jgi:transcriptional regulator with XRE-family HTH domain
MKHFGEQLRAYLKAKGIESSWLARTLGITPAGVDAYFSSQEPRIKTREKILSALEITEEDFYNFNTPKGTEEKEQTITITFSQFEYFMEAVRERDEMKNEKIAWLKAAPNQIILT